MRERRNLEVERRRQSNIQSQKKQQSKKKQSKQKKKGSKTLMIICLVLGIGIGCTTEFDIKSFIENISKYKIAIVKNDDEQPSTNSELSLNDDILKKEQNQENNAEVVSNEVVKRETSTVNQKVKQQPKKESKESKQDKINKAKQSIINECGSDFSGVVYATEAAHPTKGGNYYIFNIGPDGMGDMQFYVDTSTYKVYEYSVDGYFGEYRNGNSDVFTFDMAVRRLENELGWDERRKYTLEEQDSEGYTIRTSFISEPGSGEGLYYVTPDFLDICFE
ncbi:hypothetical protein R3379_22280 [Bacillus sp. BAU-SS-2023]|nr:hypothetical protein [Bacillus sp. BAU-SS-2023]